MQGEENPQLTITSRTEDGAEVQIDAYDPRRGVPREIKSARELGADPEDITARQRRDIQEQMERHADFANDYGLPIYEWVALTQRMADALGVIRLSLPPNLRNRIRIVVQSASQ
jgi:hypothetical protein